MSILSRLERKNRNLMANRKGFSSVVGGIFAALIIISLASTFFVWSMTENNYYNDTVRQMSQADSDRANEAILANINATRVDANNVLVGGWVQNNGPITANLTTLWVTDTSLKTYAQVSAMNITLKPGDNITVSQNVALANSLGDSLSCWFISGRGNTVSKTAFDASGATVNNYYNSTNSDTSMYSNVSQGIGLIAFDFKGFSLKDFGGNPANHTLFTLTKSYILHQDHYTVLHAILTNYDPTKLNMMINVSSTVYVLLAQAGTVKFGFYPLVSVTNESGNLYINTGIANPQYILPYGVPVDVYFLGCPAINVSPNTYPLNIMILGKLGANDYGQNVPFVSMNVVS